MGKVGIIYGNTLMEDLYFIKGLAKALSELNDEVYILCAYEENVNKYDFIDTAYVIQNRKLKRVYEKEHAESQRISLISLNLPIMLTSTNDICKEKNVKKLSDANNDEINGYMRAYEESLHELYNTFGLNGLILMDFPILPYIAAKFKERYKLKFAIRIPTQNIENILKVPSHVLKYTLKGLVETEFIFVNDLFAKNKVVSAFSELVENLESKIKIIPDGVDTAQFQLYDGTVTQFNKRIANFASLVSKFKDGRKEEYSVLMDETLKRGTLSKRDLIELSSKIKNVYNPDHPDADILDKIKRIRWEKRPIVAYVGDFSPHSGIFDLIFAIPEVLLLHDIDFIFIGYSIYREFIEMLLKALNMRNYGLVRLILEAVKETIKEKELLSAIMIFFEKLKSEGRLQEYFMNAQQLRIKDKIKILGNLDDYALAEILPLFDIIVFPVTSPKIHRSSVLKGMASGLVPIITNNDLLKDIAISICNTVTRINYKTLTIPPDPNIRINRLALNLKYWISVLKKEEIKSVIKRSIRRVTETYYSWNTTAKQIKVSLGIE